MKALPTMIRPIDEYIADKQLKKESKAKCAKEFEEFAQCTAEHWLIGKCKPRMQLLNECLRRNSETERYLQLVQEQVAKREARRERIKKEQQQGI